MAYAGDPILVEELLFRPVHSLIDQSLHSRLGATTTNGDGFGIGWYGERPEPAVFKSVHPAWNDRNLREVASQIRTPLMFAHIRASTGTPVQRSNCHPFRYGRWLWMHNGSVASYPDLKRDLMMAVDPSLYADIEGSTDSETLFFLALTFGLTDDPVTGVERAVGFVEDVAPAARSRAPGSDDRGHYRRGVDVGFPLLERGRTRSLFYSTDVAKLRELHPEVEVLNRLGTETRVVVSEPLRDLSEAWNEVPESSCGIVRPGADEIRPFRPESAAVPG